MRMELRLNKFFNVKFRPKLFVASFFQRVEQFFFLIPIILNNFKKIGGIMFSCMAISNRSEVAILLSFHQIFP